MVIARSESIGPSPPLFPDIKPSDSIVVRVHKALEQYRARFGERMPYGLPDFELASPIGEDARRELIRGMVALPTPEGYDLFRASMNLEHISNYQGNHQALERMYTGPIPESDPNRFMWARLFIENIHNSMAVRNRLRIVEREFTEHVSGLLERKKGSIEVLSVAAGSSRAIMEALRPLNGRSDNRIRLQMVDNSQAALEDGRKLVRELDIGEFVEFKNNNFLPTTEYVSPGYQADFVEVVGLFDYLKAPHIIRFLREIRRHMADGGVILYSNVSPGDEMGENDEITFTHQVVGWRHMEYRTRDELRTLAEAADFNPNKIRSIREPLGIYNFVVATK